MLSWSEMWVSVQTVSSSWRSGWGRLCPKSVQGHWSDREHTWVRGPGRILFHPEILESEFQVEYLSYRGYLDLKSGRGRLCPRSKWGYLGLSSGWGPLRSRSGRTDDWVRGSVERTLMSSFRRESKVVCWVGLRDLSDHSRKVSVIHFPSCPRMKKYTYL